MLHIGQHKPGLTPACCVQTPIGQAAGWQLSKYPFREPPHLPKNPTIPSRTCRTMCCVPCSARWPSKAVPKFRCLLWRPLQALWRRGQIWGRSSCPAWLRRCSASSQAQVCQHKQSTARPHVCRDKAQFAQSDIRLHALCLPVACQSQMQCNHRWHQQDSLRAPISCPIHKVWP